MEFTCRHTTEEEPICWTGTIVSCKGTEELCEFELKSRGSYYHVILGKHNYGYYVCIPSWDVGCELSGYTDTFWNTENLSKQIGIVDAITVATGIKEVNRLL